MVSTQQAQQVDPEFRAQCNAIFDSWRSGKLPFSDAAQRLQTMAAEAIAAKQLSNQGATEVLMGVMQGYRANLNESINHFERARDLFEQAGDHDRTVTCILNIGETYRLKGNFTRAQRFFHQAYEAAVEINNVSVQSIALTNEGQMLLSMGKVSESQEALHKAYELSNVPLETEREEKNRHAMQCEVLYALAMLYIEMDDLSTAWKYATRSLKQAEELQIPDRLGFANRAIGEVLTVLGKAPTSDIDPDPDTYFQAANEAFREVKAEGELAKTMFAHGKSLAKRGKRMAAARKLQQAMVIFTRLGMVDDAAKAAEAQLTLI